MSNKKIEKQSKDLKLKIARFEDNVSSEFSEIAKLAYEKNSASSGMLIWITNHYDHERTIIVHGNQKKDEFYATDVLYLLVQFLKKRKCPDPFAEIVEILHVIKEKNV